MTEDSKYEIGLNNKSLRVLRRLDSLPFARWHFFMVISLGAVWIFDGYEVSLISLFRKYIIEEHS